MCLILLRRRWLQGGVITIEVTTCRLQGVPLYLTLIENITFIGFHMRNWFITESWQWSGDGMKYGLKEIQFEKRSNWRSNIEIYSSLTSIINSCQTHLLKLKPIFCNSLLVFFKLSSSQIWLILMIFSAFQETYEDQSILISLTGLTEFLQNAQMLQVTLHQVMHTLIISIRGVILIIVMSLMNMQRWDRINEKFSENHWLYMRIW